MKILLLICFSVLLGFVSQDVFAETEMIGRLNIMDSFSTNAGPHPYLFWFQSDDQSAPYRLNQYTLPSNILDFAGERVRITLEDRNVPLASSLNPQEEFLDITTIELEDKPSGISQMVIPPTVRSVTLLSKFSDVSTIPSGPGGTHDQAYFQGIFYDNAGSLKNFYNASSYGKFIWNGNVSNWMNVTSPQAAYNQAFDLMVTDGIAAHEANVDFCNPTPVTNLVLIFNGPVGPAANIAFGSVGTWTNFPAQTVDWPTLDGCRITISVSWEPDNGGFFCCGQTLDRGIGVTGHEVGHNLGFEHTPPPPGAWTSVGPFNDPYHDPNSIMSSNRDQEGPSALITGQRDQVGWMDAGNKDVVANGTSKTITIDFINEPEGGINPQMVTIPLPDSTSYIIEAHTEEIFNDTPQDRTGAIMYKHFPSGNQYEYLTFGGGVDKSAEYSLVATMGTDVETDFDQAILEDAETFEDVANSVTVTVQSINSTSVTVFVSNNVSSQCSPSPGLDWAISESCSLTGNVTADMNITVQNNSVLTIPTGMTVFFDPATFSITVIDGSGILVQGSIQTTP